MLFHAFGFACSRVTQSCLHRINFSLFVKVKKSFCDYQEQKDLKNPDDEIKSGLRHHLNASLDVCVPSGVSDDPTVGLNRPFSKSSHFLSPPLSGAARRAAPGRAAVLLGGAVRLRAAAGERGRRAESEAIRAGVQGGGESGQRSVREGQVQDERHLRHAQGQRHPDGPLRLRGPHLQPGEHLLSHDPSNLT